MTTPPLPSSSPAPAMDIMEMSPLPHKPPYSITNEIEIITPGTDDLSVDSPMPSPLEDSPSVPPKDAQPE